MISAVFQGVQIIAAAASVDQARSAVSLLTDLVRKTPALLPMMCSSVIPSRPNQQPKTYQDSPFMRCAPGLRAITNSPKGNKGFE